MTPHEELTAKIQEVADLLNQRSRALADLRQRHDATLGKLGAAENRATAAERRATAAEARVADFEREKAAADKAREEAAAPLDGFGEIATAGRVRG